MPAARLSLVIPAYNEAAAIEGAIAEAESALEQLFLEFEVLIVDDGSTDATAALTQRMLPSAPHTRLLRHDVNRGYGAALRTGFDAARYELVAFTDADCQFDLLDLGRMAKLAAHAPIVAGRRRDRKDSPRRRFFSWGYNILCRAILGTRARDCDCALKVFRKEALAILLPESRGFFVNAEMLTRARLLGLEVSEVPVSHRPRAGGASKVSLREIPRTLGTLLAFWWMHLVVGRRTTPEVMQTRVTLANESPPPVSNRLPSNAPGLPVEHRAQQREAA
ncbi:MAG TPA: glycosyltransferase family 2 protein [Gemmataceae bacterium]|jgi:dolichol-phosphate mannosyltransferase